MLKSIRKCYFLFFCDSQYFFSHLWQTFLSRNKHIMYLSPLWFFRFLVIVLDVTPVHPAFSLCATNLIFVYLEFLLDAMHYVPCCRVIRVSSRRYHCGISARDVLVVPQRQVDVNAVFNGNPHLKKHYNC